MVGKEAFTLVKTLVYPKTLRDASITEIQEALLRHVRSAQFTLVERTKFYTLIRNPYETVRVFLVHLQRQASKCNFEGHLDVALRDRLVAEISRQSKLPSEKDTSFQNIRVVSETNEDLNNSTQKPTVLLHQSCSKPPPSTAQVASFKALKPRACGSCGGHHPRHKCKYR